MSQNNRSNWTMPEPIFRRSTGELVRPSDDLAVDPEPDTLDPSSPTPPEPSQSAAPAVADDPLAKLYAPPDAVTEPAPRPAAAAAVEIEPQPYITEELTAERIVVQPISPAPKKSKRSMLAAFGLIVLLAAIGGICALIYFLFFANRPNTGGF